jgi:hypothetical protein
MVYRSDRSDFKAGRNYCAAQHSVASPDERCLKVILNNNKWCGTIVRLLRWILSFKDFSLQFLVFLHLVLGLRSVARFAI